MSNLITPIKEVLAADEARALADAMQQKYVASVAERFFEVTAHKDPTGTYAMVTLRNQDGSFCYPVEARINDAAHAMSPQEAALFLVDFVDSYFEEYFREGGDVYLPIDWADYEYEGKNLQVKGQILNLALETLANRWLEGETVQAPERKTTPYDGPLH